MKKNIIQSIGVAAIAAVVLTGCGTGGQAANNSSAGTSNTSNTASAKSTTNGAITTKNGTVIENASGYAGSANLKKYQAAASSKPSDFQAQIDAGIASHVNGDDAKAIKYYQAAGKINPKSAVPYNNIGNIYLRDKKDAKSAIPYYQKATKADPTYAYGWWNLSIAQSQNGNIAAAKKAVASGLKDVKKSDPVYKSLQAMQKQLDNPGSTAGSGSNTSGNTSSKSSSKATKNSSK